MYFWLCHNCRKIDNPLYTDCCKHCNGIETVQLVRPWEWTPNNEFMWGVTPEGKLYNDNGVHVANTI
jgi:hypothetical protein